MIDKKVQEKLEFSLSQIALLGDKKSFSAESNSNKNSDLYAKDLSKLIEKGFVMGFKNFSNFYVATKKGRDYHQKVVEGWNSCFRGSCSIAGGMNNFKNPFPGISKYI